MLIEIFSDCIYDQTPCDPNNGIVSKRVPKIIISERGDTMLTNMYLKAREFLTTALDNSYYCIKTGGSYVLEIESENYQDNTCVTAAIIKAIGERKFTFKFNSLRDTIDTDKNDTIHGTVVIDEQLNVVSYTRDRVLEPVASSNTLTTRIVTDSTSTSGRRVEVVQVQDNDVSCGGKEIHPFVESCQQEVPSDSSEDAGSVTTNEDSGNPIELSKNSFSVRGGVIKVSDPDMEIGTVDGSSFSIDAEKQRRQDEFLKNMSRKISKRNSNSTRNPK